MDGAAITLALTYNGNGVVRMRSRAVRRMRDFVGSTFWRAEDIPDRLSSNAARQPNIAPKEVPTTHESDEFSIKTT